MDPSTLSILNKWSVLLFSLLLLFMCSYWWHCCIASWLYPSILSKSHSYSVIILLASLYSSGVISPRVDKGIGGFSGIFIWVLFPWTNPNRRTSHNQGSTRQNGKLLKLKGPYTSLLKALYFTHETLEGQGVSVIFPIRSGPNIQVFGLLAQCSSHWLVRFYLRGSLGTVSGVGMDHSLGHWTMLSLTLPFPGETPSRGDARSHGLVQYPVLLLSLHF